MRAWGGGEGNLALNNMSELIYFYITLFFIVTSSVFCVKIELEIKS